MPGDEEVPRPAADAVSLHTIADSNVYAAQEQEDADFALALSLEEEENRDREIVRRNRQAAEERETLIAREEEQGYRHINTTTPYRDDPNDDDHVPDNTDDFTSYRDNPEAAEDEEGGSIEAQTASRKAGRRYIRRFAKWLRGLALGLRFVGAWLLKLPRLTIFLAVLFLAVLIGGTLLTMSWGKSLSGTPKEQAFRASGSTPYNLMVPKLYPNLAASASDECRRIWDKYASNVWCHEGILSSAWDNGSSDEIKQSKLDPWAYSQWVCNRGCRDKIRSLETPMWNGCGRRTDRFDLETYGKDGRQYFRKEEVEAGPVQVALSLMARYNHLCEAPSESNRNEWGTYAADLWMRWGISDGKDASSNLGDLSKFIAATSEKRTVEGGRKTGSMKVLKDTLTYDVEIPTRTFGPGEEDTDCGSSILRWLENKMRSFEYGLILTPGRESMGLDAFNTMMVNATNRCKESEVGDIFYRVHELWSQYGWWCLWTSCRHQELSNPPPVVLQLLHGVSENDQPLVDIRNRMAEHGAPKRALQVLHDGIQSMPCGIWIEEDDLKQHIIPSDHRVRQLCSTECRNAVDNIQREHGDEFTRAARTSETSDVFEAWDRVRERVNKTCEGPAYNAITTDRTPFCAPGYAALGHPEWIFTGAPSKKDILSAFAPAMDKLAESLPHYIREPGSDAESQRQVSRKLSESVCNQCSGQLLIGTNPDWRKRITEFLGDDDVDSEEYRRVAKLLFVTCTKMIGVKVPEARLREMWKLIGLD